MILDELAAHARERVAADKAKIPLEDMKAQAEALPVDYLLLDTYVKHAYGGSGKTFDWSLIGEVNHPYFLAGGLNESNVQRAAQTGAYALDLSSGIETDDVKDIDKMRRVSALVKGANQ